MTGEELKQKILAFAPLIISVLAIINTFLSALGYPCIGIADSDITTVVSAVATIVSIIWSWWNNNNVTKDAQVSQQVLNGLKDGSLSTEQVEDLIDNADIIQAIKDEGVQDQVLTLLTDSDLQEIIKAVNEGKDIKVEIDE